MPASALKASRATTGALSPQPGQISPRGRDCCTPSGASGQWWQKVDAHSSGKCPRAPSPLGLEPCIYQGAIPLCIQRDGFLALAHVSASKCTTQTASSSSWGSPRLVAACPLSRSPSRCLDMKASELQGCQLTSCKEAVSR